MNIFKNLAFVAIVMAIVSTLGSCDKDLFIVNNTYNIAVDSSVVNNVINNYLNQPGVIDTLLSVQKDTVIQVVTWVDTVEVIVEVPVTVNIDPFWVLSEIAGFNDEVWVTTFQSRGTSLLDCASSNQELDITQIESGIMYPDGTNAKVQLEGSLCGRSYDFTLNRRLEYGEEAWYFEFLVGTGSLPHSSLVEYFGKPFIARAIRVPDFYYITFDSRSGPGLKTFTVRVND